MDEEPDLETTLVTRVDDVREIAEFDLATYGDTTLPPAVRFHYEELDCLILPAAMTDVNAKTSLSLEVSWWNRGRQVGDVQIHGVEREPTEDQDAP